MDAEQTIHSFWSSFGLTAYDENSVPDDAALPFITYSLSYDTFDNQVSMGFMPAVVIRSGNSTYYADYYYQNANYTGIIYALFGGSSADGLSTGAFYLRLYSAPEHMFQIFAASLSCKPLLN